MAKALAQFTIARTGEDYLLKIEDSDGGTSDFTLDEDQFDLMIEAIEDLLDDEDEYDDADDNDNADAD